MRNFILMILLPLFLSCSSENNITYITQLNDIHYVDSINHFIRYRQSQDSLVVPVEFKNRDDIVYMSFSNPISDSIQVPQSSCVLMNNRDQYNYFKSKRSEFSNTSFYNDSAIYLGVKNRIECYTFNDHSNTLNQYVEVYITDYDTLNNVGVGVYYALYKQRTK